MQIRVDHISKSYGRRLVFRNVSLTHRAGVMGIAGANGSGKSTLIQLVAGLMKPSSGEIHWVEGRDSENGRRIDRKDLVSRVGFVAPYMEYYEELTVRENLDFVFRLTAGSRDGGADPKALVELFDAEVLLDQPYGALSTGQRQRVKMIAAGVHQPDLYCFDEAAGNLDERGLEQLESWLQLLVEAGRTVFVASNDPRELAWCEKVYHLEG